MLNKSQLILVNAVVLNVTLDPAASKTKRVSDNFDY
jgi:hypothetical protein